MDGYLAKTTKSMKTTRNIIVIATALSIGLVGSLSASTPGKHPVDFAGPHKHVAKGGSTSHVEHTLIKRTGPPGKGIVRTSISR